MKLRKKSIKKTKKIAIKKSRTELDIKIKLNWISRKKSNEIKCSWMELYKTNPLRIFKKNRNEDQILKQIKKMKWSRMESKIKSN
jgi:hypothetical protein